MATIPFPWKTVVQDVTTWSKRWGNYGNTSRMLATHSNSIISETFQLRRHCRKLTLIKIGGNAISFETMMVSPIPNKGVHYSICSLDALSFDDLSEAEIV